jgi:putative FmdB family regulatory protein
MPIFEFVCQTCQHRFETLVLNASAPVCPSCQGTQLEKQWSAFGVGSTAGASADVGPCGSCGDPRGPGACSLN